MSGSAGLDDVEEPMTATTALVIVAMIPVGVVLAVAETVRGLLGGRRG